MLAANEVRRYRVQGSGRRWAVFCLILGLSLVLLGLGLIVWSFSHSGSLAALIALGSFFGILVGVGFIEYGWGLLRSTLVVSIKGLEYQGPGKHIQGDWDDVEWYAPVNWHGAWDTEGLLLRQRSHNKEGIPMELFAANWLKSDLGATVQFYVQQAHKRAAPPAPRPPPRRRYHRAPRSAAPAPMRQVPSARPAITQRLRPLRPSGVAVPGEWVGTVTGRIDDHDGDTVRF